MDSLPLDWTRVKRRRTDDEYCCDDPATCSRRQHVRPRLQVDPSVPIVQGRAVFCLHDPDPSWVQGYFLPDGAKRPLGILAVQEEIDECLACLDGGYRRVTMTLYEKGQQPRTYANVDWTGGDMMRLYHTELEMESDRLLTGKAALPLLREYFSGLVSKLRIQCDMEQDSPVLEWLPDIAVIVGRASVAMPEREDGTEERKV